MTNAHGLGILFLGTVICGAQAGFAAQPFELKKRDHIVVMGHGVAEQMRRSGYLETLIHTRLPELQLRIRHLGDAAEQRVLTPGVGVEDSAAMLDKQLTEQKADVIIAVFDLPASNDKARDWALIGKNLSSWIQRLRSKKYNGESAPRLILVSPVAVEDLGRDGDRGAKVRKRNEQLALYSARMALIAKLMDVGFIDLFTPTASLAPTGGTYRGPNLTGDGVKLNDYGCWLAAHLLADKLAPLKGGDRLVVDVKAQKIKATRSFGESASFSDTGFRFFRLAEYYPPPAAPSESPVHAEFRDRQQTVVVRGLKKGKYTLLIDGQMIASATHDQWAAGVAITQSPAQVRTQQLRTAVNKKSQIFFKVFKATGGLAIYGSSRKFEIPAASSKQLAELTKQLADADDAIGAAAMRVRTERWLLEKAKQQDSKHK